MPVRSTYGEAMGLLATILPISDLLCLMLSAAWRCWVSVI